MVVVVGGGDEVVVCGQVEYRVCGRGGRAAYKRDDAPLLPLRSAVTTGGFL